MTHDELQNNSSDTGTKVPMTHDELLARLNDYGYGVPPLNALRAVVELHKPDPDSCPCCGPVLDVCGVEYPCPTIQTIQKELNG